MKVIEKKTKEWHVGDVICYWNHDSNERFYGLITHNADGYNKASLNYNYGSMFNNPANNIDNLMKKIANNWDYVEKVNTHLVVED